MRAIVYETGGVDALEIIEVPDKVAEAGEVLVRVKACAMNHLDVWATKNPTGRRFGGPRIMGADVSGVVENVGPGVPGFSPGDRVVMAPGLSCHLCVQCQRGRHADCPEYKLLGVGADGGYSELMRIPAVNVAPLPDGISFEDGASIPLVFITAWRILTEKTRVDPGEWVLVNSAGSGVGIAAIQIAKVFGGRVVATASTEAKRQKALELGAEAVVDYTKAGWPQEVIKIADGRGVDVAVDSASGQILVDTLEAMAPGGRVINCGATDTNPIPLDPNTFRSRRISLAWSFMGSNSYMHNALKLVSSGQMRAVVHRVYPFEQVQDAHRCMINRESFGKIVLTW